MPRRGDVCVGRQRTGGVPARAVLERVGAPQSLPRGLEGWRGPGYKKFTTNGTQGSGTKDGFDLGMGIGNDGTNRPGRGRPTGWSDRRVRCVVVRVLPPTKTAGRGGAAAAAAVVNAAHDGKALPADNSHRANRANRILSLWCWVFGVGKNDLGETAPGATIGVTTDADRQSMSGSLEFFSAEK